MAVRRFGEVLRDMRRKADRTLGQVSRMLDVSTVYLSDVERGNRKPFTRQRILKIAEFLETNPNNLLQAADRERGVIEYDISKSSSLEVEVVGGLVTGLARGGVTKKQLGRIKDILKEGDK